MSQRARDWLIGITVGVGATLVMLYAIEVIGAEQPPIRCMNTEIREKVRVILLAGLDDALKDRVMHVFEVWMKDSSQQPARASVGVRQATRAYVESREFVERWNPPPCVGSQQP